MKSSERQIRLYQAPTKAPAVDTEKRTAELSFSSETPVELPYGGTEVLSHKPGAADLSRLNARAPLLFNHDAADILGVVESARVVNGRGVATVRFGRDQRGEWAMQQAADGVLTSTSLTYIVDQRSRSRGSDQVIAEKWRALEISLVSVPADHSVGVGRSTTTLSRKTAMAFEDDDDDQRDQQPRPSRTQREQRGAETERQRMLEIGALGRKYKLPAAQIEAMQREGTSIDDARARTWEYVQRTQRAQPTIPVGGSTEIGLDNEETQKFSLMRAINAMASNDWSDAGLERECSRAVGQKLGKQTRGIFVPAEVMARTPWRQQRAIYQVGAPSTGGALVETQLLADAFIEVLRNESAVLSAGAMTLSGLVGNVDIPRQDGQTTTYWVAESGVLTEAEVLFDTLSLRPKTIGCLSKISRLALMQTTPALEALVRKDMVASIGLGIDLAALSGPGTGAQPTGVASTAGIAQYIGGTNGANVTLDTVIGMEKVMANANAPLAGRAYIMNPSTIASLKTLKASTGAYLWTTAPTGQRSSTPGTINGYPLFETNQARNTLTKGTSAGVCSEIFFGAWPEIIVGEWGVLEILVNPFMANDFQKGDVQVRAMHTIDIGVRHPAAFVYMADALTP
jgi:HK97 family phage major capsid protein